MTTSRRGDDGGSVSVRCDSPITRFSLTPPTGTTFTSFTTTGGGRCYAYDDRNGRYEPRPPDGRLDVPPGRRIVLIVCDGTTPPGRDLGMDFTFDGTATNVAVQVAVNTRDTGYEVRDGLPLN